MRDLMLGVTTHEPSATPVTRPLSPSTSMNPSWLVDSENIVVTGIDTTSAPSRSPVSSGASVPHCTST